jgi:hypothetical protein
VVRKEAEKILKHRNLTAEIERMWTVTATVTQVIAVATGAVSNSLRQYLRNVMRKQEVKDLQQTAILGTAHRLRAVLMCGYKTCFRGEMTLHVAQTVYTEL